MGVLLQLYFSYSIESGYPVNDMYTLITHAFPIALTMAHFGGKYINVQICFQIDKRCLSVMWFYLNMYQWIRF